MKEPAAFAKRPANPYREESYRPRRPEQTVLYQLPRDEFYRLMKVAVASVNAEDFDTAAKPLELANQELTKVETIIKRAPTRGQ